MFALNLFFPRRATLAMLSTLMLASPGFAQNLLQGNVNHTDTINSGGPSNTSLNRSEMRGSRSVSQPAQSSPALDQAFAPQDFNVQSMAPPPPPAFNLNAQSQAQNQAPEFSGQQGVPMMEQQPTATAPFNLNAQQAMQPPAAPADPDSTPEMKLQWDAWHHRVAEAIFVRYQSLSNAAFRNSPPIAAIAAYTVTRDGKICNVRLNQKSPNPMYNAVVLMAIQSLNGNNAILQFPENSRRMTVEKQGQFTQNYNQQIGFKNVIGDQETIARHR